MEFHFSATITIKCYTITIIQNSGIPYLKAQLGNRLTTTTFCWSVQTSFQSSRNQKTILFKEADPHYKYGGSKVVDLIEFLG